MNNTLVEAEIWTMARTDKGSAVLIKPIGAERAVPIFIGQLEAQAILVGMGNIKLPRPLTHDLFMGILKEISLNIERIEIYDLIETTFHAHIIARQGKKKYEFDSRPSDAIAIAIRIGCPVYIAEYIVNEAGVPTSIIADAERLSVNKTTIEELKRALDIAVSEENYEDAAKIRDRIRELEESEPNFDDETIHLEDGILGLFVDMDSDEFQEDDDA